jgi:hypothetical protein
VLGGDGGAPGQRARAEPFLECGEIRRNRGPGRGLMRLDTGSSSPRLFFTDAGLVELRAMMADRRLADPVKFAHIRQELGINPA